MAYWYAASLQQNFFLPHTSAYSLPQTKSLPQICSRSAAGLRHTFHFPMGIANRTKEYIYLSLSEWVLMGIVMQIISCDKVAWEVETLV